MFVFPFVCFVRPHSRDSLFRFTKDGKHLLWVSLVRDAKVFWLDVGVLVCNPHEREESVSSRRRVALRGNHPVSAFVRVNKVVQSAARCGMVWLFAVQGYLCGVTSVCSAMLCDAVRARDIVESFMIGFVWTDIACLPEQSVRTRAQARSVSGGAYPLIFIMTTSLATSARHHWLPSAVFIRGSDSNDGQCATGPGACEGINICISEIDVIQQVSGPGPKATQ